LSFIKYNNMPLLYNLDMDTPEELLAILADNVRKRRLEKGLSREALTTLSGVPTPTIAKFEQKHTISLSSFVALAKALGYAKDIKVLLSQPLFDTMEELETINKNKNRKKGRNEINK
jgi:transcriptional regulator with XRE-family HTH domain